jgi:predicted Zn-dependent protease
MKLSSFPFCYLVVVLVLSFAVSGCKKSAKLYLVPIGDVSMEEINDLASHYRQKFGITVEVLPQLKPDETVIDSTRHQLIAENLVQLMLHYDSDYRLDPADVLIGITGQDIYPKSQDWEFCFGWRVEESRAAVVSTARMDLHYLGEPAGQATLRQRLRKVVTKDIGILFYGKDASDNPRSVLYNGIMGIQELDRVTEEF